MSDDKRVLLVEDDDLVLATTAAVLEDAGFAVHPARSYAEALEAIGEGPGFATLVTDVRLAGSESGLDLAARVAEECPDTGIIILSGAVRPGQGTYPEKALFCTKPCSPDALARLVSESRNW